MAKKTSGSSADTIIKLVLIFFISLLSFSVGTYVGKQVSDADYRRAAIEGDYNHFQAETEGAPSDESESLSDEDIASLTEEFVNTEKRKLASADSAKEEASTDSKNNTDKTKPKGYKKYSKAKPSEATRAKAKGQNKLIATKKQKPTIEKAAQRVAANKSPVTQAKSERKPTSVLPGIASSSIGKYTVQVASYADEGEAKAHSAKLKSKGWNAFYIPAEIKGRTWFRVSVGLFSTTASAEKFKKELVKEANISSAYVSKIVR